MPSHSYAGLSQFSLLAQTYVSDYARVAPHYAGDFADPTARAAVAEHAAGHTRDRDLLVEVLLDQNAAWGIDEATKTNIERLLDPESVAVVTGQQVGLFTGPLYTLYKTVTAIQLARKIEEETGRPAVAVFWLEGEDHDFDEMAGTSLLRGNDLVSVRYTGHALPPEGNLGPIGRLELAGQIEEAVQLIDDTLPPSDFKPELLQHLREAYTAGATMRDAFARLMKSFFPNEGLVFISPDDQRFKELLRPLFAQELAEFATSFARLQAVSDELSEPFHAQIYPSRLNLFLLTEDGRFALDPEADGRVRLKGTEQTHTLSELRQLLADSPEMFSANVALRPIAQDVLLPTAAYVAGPGEIAYFAQLKPLYEWAGVPMPIVYPRASVSLVEGKVQKVMDRYGIDLPALAGDPNVLFKHLVMDQMDVDLDAAFNEIGAKLHQAVNEIKPIAAGVDSTLSKSAESVRASFMKEWNGFKGRVLKAEKRNNDVIEGQLDKARVNLLPAGKLQERVVSPLYFLNKYGLDLPTRCLNGFDLDTSRHQVFEV